MTVVLFILGVLVVVVGIIVSIALHEVGHLVPAKLFGVRVTQYMIGFGRTLFSVRRGETEYGLKAIPAGGYIAMIGMYPPARQDGRVRASTTGMFQTMADDARRASAAELQPGDENRMFYRLPVWKRIIIMLGGPFMNLAIGVVLIGVLLMGFGTAQPTTTVGSLSQCVVTAAQQQRTGQTSCRATDKPSPAVAAKLQPGDTIVSFAGTDVTSWNQLTTLIRQSAGRSVPVVVDRDGTWVTSTITPVTNDVAVLDAKGNPVRDANGTVQTTPAGFIGVGPTQQMVPQPITAVPPMVSQNVGAVVGVVLNLPQRMVEVGQAAFSSAPRDPNGPMSVVGVGRIAGEVASTDLIDVRSKVAGLVGLLASVNIALFVFNLIPLLPLDGGHIAGALWEAVRRGFARLFRRRDPGPVDIAKLMPVTYVVAGLLLVMGALLIFADIVKPITLF
ncbi:zinc metalloprotease [Tersicoccus phoenicis]|uniref:Zinc metalloprotease n=1 Tax=Tersicoccus phoenicis TaxID=554083 RepID=A0A1R1L9H7_9MICC|nr:site-2 protease family protein [Tersicoccus phoenicis]OMH24173.1 zinc metalloprotease [Tersicoccus phoenicis]